MLALQLLRRDARALDWVVQLSGAPFPAPMPGDAALARRRPRALWGHGGLDPLFDEEREERVREFMTAHTRLEEERRPELGHAVDEIELRAVAAFLQRRAYEASASPSCPRRALPPPSSAKLLFSALLATTLQNSMLHTSRSRTGRARAPGGRDLKPGAVREGKGPDTAPLSDPVGS